jgi:hypothetical protein
VGRRTIKRKGEAGRPSTFFLIALALGVIIVLALFIQVISHPMVAK